MNRIPNLPFVGFNQTTCDGPWPGFIIFLKGCNMVCPYCHNQDLLKQPALDENIAKNQIYKMVNNPLVKMICISGGEPTIHGKQLIEFIYFLNKFREKGLKIKLDTNGSNPHLLSEILRLNLVDFVAMDIKAPFFKYPQLFSSDVKLPNQLQMSSNLLTLHKTPHEFRTTMDSRLTSSDYKWIEKKFPNIKYQEVRSNDSNSRINESNDTNKKDNL